MFGMHGHTGDQYFTEVSSNNTSIFLLSACCMLHIQKLT